MTAALSNILKTAGITQKAPILDRNIYGEPSGNGHNQYYHSYGSNKGGGGGGKHSIALTALTLLAFLFFLNILQNCIQEQTDSNQPTPQVMVLSSRIKQPREAEKRKGTETDGDVDGETETSKDDDDDEDEMVEPAEEKTYLKIAKRVLETAMNAKGAPNFRSDDEDEDIEGE